MYGQKLYSRKLSFSDIAYVDLHVRKGYSTIQCVRPDPSSRRLVQVANVKLGVESPPQNRNP